MNTYYNMVTKENLQKPHQKIFKGLKMTLKHLVFDFDDDQLSKDSAKKLDSVE
jgi:hypothetical protein